MKYINKIKYLKTVVIFCIIFCFASQSSAALKSTNYIIYESVMHTFDGPVISGVSQSVSGTTATINWQTNVTSDAFVVYDTDSSFADSKEQGSSVKSGTGHSVEVTGLEAGTTYYYRVKSERVNGGVTTDTTLRSFTTGGESTEEGEEERPVSGGGGILIIGRRADEVPPLIMNVNISNITYDSVLVAWETDEEATSFVEYGETLKYGSTYGAWGTSTSHTVVLENLEPETTYNLRVLSSDAYGNYAYSDNRIFTTLAAPPEAGEEIDEPASMPDISTAINFINRLFPEVYLNDLAGIDNIDELSRFLSSPILSGEPGIEIEATQARITWSTDIESTSQVALSTEAAYNENPNNPYQQIIGNTEDFTTLHEVVLYGLTPDTTYHFQLRSKAQLGPTAISRDYTFKTSIEELQIISYYSQVIDNETALFRWVTNKEADSAVTFAPYLGGVLAIDQSKTIKDNSYSVIHEITVSDFVAGTFYDIELSSSDQEGNVVTKILPQFSTSDEDMPPEISHIKADSTVFVDRSNKTQTIISWLTNEPSTSRVYFQEGVHGSGTELSDSTNLNTNYTKEHVMVITKFKPGVVYSFQVESIDSTDNAAVSKIHTFMTAKKKESIITIIMNILENTFGWLKQLM